MSTSAALIDSVVREHVAPVMKRAGFRKNARNWHRESPRAVQVLNVQGSSWNGPESARFTVNLGLFFPSVAALTSDKPPAPRNVPEYACTLRERIGFLMPDRSDMWWRLTNVADIAVVGPEVSDAIGEYALPWLDRLADEREAIARLVATDYAATSPVIGFALALAVDDRDLAAALYNDWISSHDARAAAKVVAWAERHGLTTDAGQPQVRD